MEFLQVFLFFFLHFVTYSVIKNIYSMGQNWSIYKITRGLDVQAHVFDTHSNLNIGSLLRNNFKPQIITPLYKLTSYLCYIPLS